MTDRPPVILCSWCRFFYETPSNYLCNAVHQGPIITANAVNARPVRCDDVNRNNDCPHYEPSLLTKIGRRLKLWRYSTPKAIK